MKLIDLRKPLCIEILINGSWSKEIPDEVKVDIKTAFEQAAGVHKVSVPLDIIDNLTPAKWVSDFGTDEYDWE